MYDFSFHADVAHNFREKDELLLQDVKRTNRILKESHLVRWTAAKVIINKNLSSSEWNVSMKVGSFQFIVHRLETFIQSTLCHSVGSIANNKLRNERHYFWVFFYFSFARHVAIEMERKYHIAMPNVLIIFGRCSFMPTKNDEWNEIVLRITFGNTKRKKLYSNRQSKCFLWMNHWYLSVWLKLINGTGGIWMSP